MRLSSFSDPPLRLYGAFIALTHAVCMLFWRSTAAVNFLGKEAEAVCWPMLPGCEALRVLSISELGWALRGYFGAAIVVALLFLLPKFLKLALAGLAGLTLFQIFVIALDFRLRANQNYMALWMTAAFFLAAPKRDVLRVLMVMFYVWAGSLKLNMQWISGASLPRTDWLIPDALVVPACIYLIVLEMGISWGLLARRSLIFWGSLAQFAVFHAVSWQQVGFFFPMTMFPLLAIFPLLRLMPPSTREEPSLLSRIFTGQAPRPVYGTMLLFSLFQLPPRLIPGDAAVTGEGRSFALHMVDAGVTCRGWADVRTPRGDTTVVVSGRSVIRMHCDPILIRERARNICEGTSSLVREAIDLDLHLESRRGTDSVDHTVIDIPGFCGKRIRYNPFGRNDWIRVR